MLLASSSKFVAAVDHGLSFSSPRSKQASRQGAAHTRGVALAHAAVATRRHNISSASRRPPSQLGNSGMPCSCAWGTSGLNFVGYSFGSQFSKTEIKKNRSNRPEMSGSTECPPLAETMESGKKQLQQHHFVLVHGVCHGAWCWYKVATVLSSAGHRVTALDLAACGASPGRAEEVPSFEEYSRPLLDAVAGLPPEEKAILVGHSFGGHSLALAMERYPDRVAVAVFVSAAMPAAGKPMNFVFEQASQEKRPADFYLDCKSATSGDPQHPVETFELGPQYLELKLYQLSPPEDLTLAKAMVRPSRRFGKDATLNGTILTEERYGAVSRVFVVAEEDRTWSADFQRQMASWKPGTEVRGLQGADHMPMFSKPKELSEILMEIADNYT